MLTRKEKFERERHIATYPTARKKRTDTVTDPQFWKLVSKTRQCCPPWGHPHCSRAQEDSTLGKLLFDQGEKSSFLNTSLKCAFKPFQRKQSKWLKHT
jgi:hypothetical protein